MHNMMLSWQQGLALTLALGVVAVACTALAGRFACSVAPFAREATMIAGLYTLWQLIGELSRADTGGALARGRWIERTEHLLRLPREADLQVLVDNRFTGHLANLYYATMHFGVLFVFLLWLFVRHRSQYREVRRVLTVATLTCLLIQLVPVAPPRLLPGFVDTAQRYGDSVYGAGGADELSAMPSVHVAWAVLIGWTVWRIGRGRWRALGPAHAVVTVLVVVSTANHWWADGIVAVAVLGLAWAVCRSAERLVADVVARGRGAHPRPDGAPTSHNGRDSGMLPATSTTSEAS